MKSLLGVLNASFQHGYWHLTCPAWISCPIPQQALSCIFTPASSLLQPCCTPTGCLLAVPGNLDHSLPAHLIILLWQEAFEFCILQGQHGGSSHKLQHLLTSIPHQCNDEHGCHFIKLLMSVQLYPVSIERVPGPPCSHIPAPAALVGPSWGQCWMDWQQHEFPGVLCLYCQPVAGLVVLLPPAWPGLTGVSHELTEWRQKPSLQLI